VKEKEIRDRIERFMQKTARRIVVPASVGIGLSAAACDHHALRGKAADGGRDLAAQTADATSATPDTADGGGDLADAAAATDLPLLAIPYVVIMPPDAARLEAAADGSSEAGAASPDLGPEILPPPPPPYIVPMVSGPGPGPLAAADPAATTADPPAKK
jgi:hypothetical protein